MFFLSSPFKLVYFHFKAAFYTGCSCSSPHCWFAITNSCTSFVGSFCFGFALTSAARRISSRYSTNTFCIKWRLMVDSNGWLASDSIVEFVDLVTWHFHSDDLWCETGFASCNLKLIRSTFDWMKLKKTSNCNLDHLDCDRIVIQRRMKVKNYSNPMIRRDCNLLITSNS